MRADAESDLADAGLAEAIAGSETETPDTAVPDAAVPALGLPCKVNSDCAPATVPCHVARCQLDFHCAVVQETDGAACDDGDACTAKDQCKGGACAAGPPACGCKSNAECAALDDGDKCNGGWRCDLASTPPRCEADPASAPTCFPLTEEPCQLNVCVPATGACAPKPAADGTVCDDGLFCTQGDACLQGACVPGKNACPCQQAQDCPDDGNVCNGVPYCDKSAVPYACKANPGSVVTCDKTGDTACLAAFCNPKTGACAPKAAPDATPCEDGKACTAGDACAAGTCKPGADTCGCKQDADCAPFEDGVSATARFSATRPSARPSAP